jgi:HlyD family secretion protein
MELTTKETFEIRSGEVDEIISQMPRGLIRWGIGLIFFLFVGLLSICWFVKYPDVVKAKVVVTTNPAPINLVSRNSGKIFLLKRENEALIKNDIIAYLQTNAQLNDIIYLDKSLASFETSLDETTLFTTISLNLKVGDLQVYLSNTIKALVELDAFKENELQERQIQHLKKQIVSYKRLNLNLQKQLDIIQQEGLLSTQKFKADSLLLTQQVIAQLDFNKTKSDYLAQQRGIRNMEASFISNQLQIDGLEKQITELDISLRRERNQVQIASSNAINELSSQLKNWKENFLFVAPTNGTLAYLGFLENEQYVEISKHLFAIIPSSKQLLAKAELPLNGSGKVREGQVVNIQLTSYPYEQFGMLVGKVESVSQVPENENYTVLISLPNGMNSTYNKQLQFKPELQGNTEIITEDLRILDRVFYSFRKLLIKK